MTTPYHSLWILCNHLYRWNLNVFETITYRSNTLQLMYNMIILLNVLNVYLIRHKNKWHSEISVTTGWSDFFISPFLLHSQRTVENTPRNEKSWRMNQTFLWTDTSGIRNEKTCIDNLRDYVLRYVWIYVYVIYLFHIVRRHFASCVKI